MAVDEDGFTAPMKSRGLTGPFGKFSEEVKTHLDEHTYQLWLRWCAQGNLLPGEMLRELLYLALHGRGVHDMAAEVTRQHFESKGLDQARLRGGRS